MLTVRSQIKFHSRRSKFRQTTTLSETDNRNKIDCDNRERFITRKPQTLPKRVSKLDVCSNFKLTFNSKFIIAARLWMSAQFTDECTEWSVNTAHWSFVRAAFAIRYARLRVFLSPQASALVAVELQNNRETAIVSQHTKFTTLLIFSFPQHTAPAPPNVSVLRATTEKHSATGRGASMFVQHLRLNPLCASLLFSSFRYTLPISEFGG